MALGMLYALSEEKIEELLDLPKEERFDYMLDEIEEELFGSEEALELDEAWEGLHYCFCGGSFSEENRLPATIIYAGELITDSEDGVITLKDRDSVEEIVNFLKENDVEELVRENFPKIQGDYSFPKDDDYLDYLLGWGEDLLEFYEHALEEDCQVIFSVSL